LDKQQEIDMKGAWLGILLIGLGVEARAIGSIADVQLIDRDTGSVLPAYRYHGEYWVAGRPGARYSIMIQNHRGERVLAVMAVDGINIISGETGAWGQSGYVLSGGERYEIAGWRKSDAEIAAFNFVDAGRSYAAHTGRPANIGVIGVALFLERPARPPTYEAYDQKAEEYSRERDSAARAAPQSPSPTESTTVTGSLSSAPKLADAQAQSNVANMAPAQKLGTGHGAREASYVQSTTFDRRSSTPNEVIKIRYDSFENLVAMGVIRSRPVWPPTPNPFPDSMPRYVPDPPAG
jgi:hypothetical protein